MKLEAYTDGSYSSKHTDRVGAGYILLNEAGEEVGRNNAFSTSPWLVEMRNVGGEILAAQMAINEANRLGADVLEVKHDYKGVGAWPDGEWNANKSQTKIYRDFVTRIRQNGLAVTFTWVQGHSGDRYNDIADQLAKEAI